MCRSYQIATNEQEIDLRNWQLQGMRLESIFVSLVGSVLDGWFDLGAGGGNWVSQDGWLRS
jgi:hypothetical protein